MDWRGGNGFVPVSVVQVHGAEVSNKVNHEEDAALAGLHGQITPVRVSLDGVAGRCGDKSVIDGRRRTQDIVRGIGREGKDEDDD